MDMNQQGLHLINIGITLAFISKNTIFAKSSLIWIYRKKNRICASQYERAEPLVSGGCTQQGRMHPNLHGQNFRKGVQS